MRSTRETFRGDEIAVEELDYPDQAKVAVAHQKFSQMGVAITPRCIAFNRNEVDIDFPSDGTGLAQEGAVDRIRLAADVPVDVEYEDLIIVRLDLPHEWRVISAFDVGTLDATPSTPWSTPIAAGTPYTLLVNGFLRNAVILKPEYEDADTVVDVYLVPYSVPQAPGDPLHRLEDFRTERLDARGHSRAVKTPGRFHGRMANYGIRGYLGCKFTVAAREGVGFYDLYSGGA